MKPFCERDIARAVSEAADGAALASTVGAMGVLFELIARGMPGANVMMAGARPPVADGSRSCRPATGCAWSGWRPTRVMPE